VLRAGLAIPRDHSLSAILLLLFCRQRLCSVIYEIVWFQLLGLVIVRRPFLWPSSSRTFMGGMCLGCPCLPPLFPKDANPYAFTH